MRLWFVLMGSLAVLLWWFVNGLLMLLSPGKFDGLIWWPVSRWYNGYRQSAYLSTRVTRTLGGLFALASGCLLAVVILAIIGLVLQHLKTSAS